MTGHGKTVKRFLCMASTVFLALGVLFVPLSAQTGPRLGELYPLDALGGILTPREQWHPFPTWAERDWWASLPEDTRSALVARGEKALGGQWPALPATLYLEFLRNGNRSRYEAPYFERRSMLGNLVLAECVEGKGRFVDEIVNGLWLIMEESSWVIPAHISAQKAGTGLPDTQEPVVDLFAAETAGLLAWTYYLVGPRLDEVSPLVTPRLLREMRTRILEPCSQREDFWWMAFQTDHINNWNPWCNSNWLTSVLLLEDNEQARRAAVHKIMRSLDRFTGSYRSDGGCDEGPSYWGVAAASLFDCLELLKSASGGKIDIYDKPLIQEMGRYIYRVHINENYFINFADAPARVGIPYDLVYRYGKRIGDQRMSSLGAYFAGLQLPRNPAPSGGLGRQLPALSDLAEIRSAVATQPFVGDVWLDGIQVMAARSRQGSASGLYVAAKGGHNAESHNHNDVGNFIVYMDGRPALIDAGVETYTAKTFSSQRYEIWTMQSAYHNLPTINGVMQKEGRNFAARDVSYKSGGSFAELSLDIAGAYPENAGAVSWKRTVRLNRGKEVRVTDKYRLSKVDGDLFLSLITPCEVILDKPGKITLRERAAQGAAFSLGLLYEAPKLTAGTEEITIEDPRLRSIWGGKLTRIILRASQAAPASDTWTLRVVQ